MRYCFGLRPAPFASDEKLNYFAFVGCVSLSILGAMACLAIDHVEDGAGCKIIRAKLKCAAVRPKI